MNNKQIMYDCDKGYILSERGPVGATCVAGLWRPTELPKCSMLSESLSLSSVFLLNDYFNILCISLSHKLLGYIRD